MNTDGSQPAQGLPDVALNRPAPADSPSQRSLLSAGALAAAIGVIAVMPFFYPLGRFFDPNVGGDTPIGLVAELGLGFFSGLLFSPVAGLIGSAVAYLLNGRRIGPFIAVVLIASASALAVGLWIALSRGQVADESGSLRSIQWIATLGAMAGAVSVTTYEFAHRALVARLTTADPF